MSSAVKTVALHGSVQFPGVLGMKENSRKMWLKNNDLTPTLLEVCTQSEGLWRITEQGVAVT